MQAKIDIPRNIALIDTIKIINLCQRTEISLPYVRQIALPPIHQSHNKRTENIYL